MARTRRACEGERRGRCEGALQLSEAAGEVLSAAGSGGFERFDSMPRSSSAETPRTRANSTMSFHTLGTCFLPVCSPLTLLRERPSAVIGGAGMEAANRLRELSV